MFFPNTEFSYTYTDASNFKTRHKVILVGELTQDATDELMAIAGDEEGFIPSFLGLEDIQHKNGGVWDEEVDHDLHVADGVQGIFGEPTPGLMSAGELLEAFRNLDREAMARHALKLETDRQNNPSLTY